MPVANLVKRERETTMAKAYLLPPVTLSRIFRKEKDARRFAASLAQRNKFPPRVSIFLALGGANAGKYVLWARNVNSEEPITFR